MTEHEVDLDVRINALYDDETNAPMINDAINVIVNTIQKNIVTHNLSRHLKAIMNSWIRTYSWYIDHEIRMSKFEHCLRNVVSKEMKSRVVDLLKIRYKEYENGLGSSVNEDDLALEVLRVSMSQSTSNYFWDFWDMDTKLTLEADRYRRSNGECIIHRDYERPFSWFSKRTMSTHYRLPHVATHLKNVIPLEVLALDFKHDPKWECSICVEVVSVNHVNLFTSHCVRTACKHIFHMACLDNCKRVYLEQKANYNKMCVPCPLCRAPIY
jgi:hypothetical protein